MSRQKRGTLAGLVMPFGLAALLGGGYFYYWRSIASAIEAHVSQAMPSLAGEASPMAVKVSGFPYRLTLDITNFQIAAPNGSRFKASRLSATASPFNPDLWVLEGAIDPSLQIAHGPSRPLRATDLKASVRLNTTGLARASLVFQGLAAEGQMGWSTGPGAFHLVADPKDFTRLALSADLADLSLSQEPTGPAAILGNKITKLRVAGPISQGPTLLQSAKEWAKRDGKLEVMAGEILWGPLALTEGRGQIALSQTGQWQGNLQGIGALKPESVAVPALTSQVSVQIEGGILKVLGVQALSIPNAFE